MHFLFLVTVLVYLAAGIFQLLYLTIRESSETPTLRPRIALIAFWVTAFGFVLLTVFIFLWLTRQGHFPMTHWTDSTAFFAWAITLTYLIIVRLTQLDAIGGFVIPGAFITILISYSFSRDTSAYPENLKAFWLVPHVTLIFLSYAVFFIAFAFGLLYLIAEKIIREKRHTIFHNLLPSLGTSDELGYRCTVLGVLLLTIGVIIGAVWTQYIDEDVAWRWLDSQVLFTVVTWIIYVVHMSFRQMWGWRGRKAAYSEIIGFIAVLCTYIGVNLFLDSAHTLQ